MWNYCDAACSNYLVRGFLCSSCPSGWVSQCSTLEPSLSHRVSLFWYVGMCECCVAPILILMTSMFYKKDEQARRISWFYVMVRIHETHKSSTNLSNYSYWISEWTHSSIWWICCIWYLILWRTCNSPIQDCLPASRWLGNTRWCLCTHMATWFSGTCSHAY